MQMRDYRHSCRIFFRFALCAYLKAMMRDKIGELMSRKDTEMFLNQWIQNYVTPDDTASASTRRSFSLRKQNRSGGSCQNLASIKLWRSRPHPADELSVSLRR